VTITANSSAPAGLMENLVSARQSASVSAIRANGIQFSVNSREAACASSSVIVPIGPCFSRRYWRQNH
jgi:hypothetical protein